MRLRRLPVLENPEHRHPVVINLASPAQHFHQLEAIIVVLQTQVNVAAVGPVVHQPVGVHAELVAHRQVIVVVL